MAARRRKPAAGLSRASRSVFCKAVRAALAEADGEATKLHRVAQTLVTLAIDGNMAAIKEISDRLEVRPGAKAAAPAAAAVQTEEPGPVEITVKWLEE